MPNSRIKAHLGAYRALVDATLADLSREQVVSRLWNGDHTLWNPEPTEITNRLGWLSVAQSMQQALPRLTTLADEIRSEGIRDVVLLGMGGSSLGPEVLRQTFGTTRGYPRLWVLDSTVPSWVRAVTKAINPARSLFLVASKSGGTIEVMSLLAHFEHQVGKAKGNRGGAQFVAITDPDTSLGRLAGERGFRTTFENPPDIGGRYSVLSFFGLVPAALTGVKIDRLLERAEVMAQACRTESPASSNPGAYLGAVLGALAREGKNKVTLLTSPALQSFGLWAEQLLAESTGKLGKGLVPVAGEPLASAKAYGTDRVCVYLRLKGDTNGALDRHAKTLIKAGHPLVELSLKDRYDLGQEFFRWEFATAVAGHVLGIHPFDQPNVQESKDNTARILREVQSSGRLPTVVTVQARSAVAQLLAHSSPGAYVGILAYLQPSPAIERALRQIRLRCMAEAKVATTSGYGPRYLHSTGQVHKGGPPQGLFLQVLDSFKPDVAIPGQSYTFGTLAQAQAIGDLQSLAARGLPVLQVKLGTQPLTALRTLGTRSASKPRSAPRKPARPARRTGRRPGRSR